MLSLLRKPFDRMRKLLLSCGYSPGDIVMLTAAVRDLHRAYPGQFLTDVRTACDELWLNNPYLTSLDAEDPGVEEIKCDYPLIDQANQAPYHCLHGFIEFLNETLDLAIRPTEFKGDIHLSAREKAWYSQVHELTGEDTPFWIIAAGGKYDVTIKWWSAERYQAVVDQLRGEVAFVQVGEFGHHHPKLRGVIDLRGKTSLRELLRLVYHSQGVLCGVTALMHLAAAVEGRSDRASSRPCVVVAGGREPVAWEAYPHHQFIHTLGALRCCANGGCWRDRVRPIGDGEERDRPENLCVDVVGDLPRCMEMIHPEEVVRRIRLFLDGGMAKALEAGEWRAFQSGVAKTKRNKEYDDQPLTLHTAPKALERRTLELSGCPGEMEGRGIVMCGGGSIYFTNAWVSLHILRHLGCQLPVELWHLDSEVDASMSNLMAPLGVKCVNAERLRKHKPVRRIGGWELKPYAILHSKFSEVLFLDADNIPVRDPEYLFELPEFRRDGAIFWPDYGTMKETDKIWKNCSLVQPSGPEIESGQILIDKSRCWRGLELALWFNEHSDFYYQYLHGDKETFRIAFEKLGLTYHLVQTPPTALKGTMCQHDPRGDRVFQHRNTAKWHLWRAAEKVDGFWLEAKCEDALQLLRKRWDGLPSGVARRVKRIPKLQSAESAPRIRSCMITCRGRHRLRCGTLAALAATDWPEEPVIFEDVEEFSDAKVRQTRTAYRALRAMASEQCDYVVFFEDDLAFNAHLFHNLTRWYPVRERLAFGGSLYRPVLHEVACSCKSAFALADARLLFGSQALVLARDVLNYILDHWDEVSGMQDRRVGQLLEDIRPFFFFHMPSLVQHTGWKSGWGGRYHQAIDFDAGWKSSETGCIARMSRS